LSRHVLHYVAFGSAAAVAFCLGADLRAQSPAPNIPGYQPAGGVASSPLLNQAYPSATNVYANAPPVDAQTGYPAPLTPSSSFGPATGAMQPYPPNVIAQGPPDAGFSQPAYGNPTSPTSGFTRVRQSPICTQCEDGSCDACRNVVSNTLGCQDCPRFGFEAFELFDTFRGPPEGTGPSNFGEVTGLNAAMPAYEPWGIGWQLGASYGLYDFSGRPAPATQLTGAQQQIFVTTGFFRRAKSGQHLSFGFVHDWMVNNNYSQFALSPTLSQWRGQVEWAFSGRNSLGLWGTFHDKSYIGDRPDNHNQFRAISQINAFWHHKYALGADTWLRIGMPLSQQFVGNGLAGSAIVGATAQVPLNERLALYANAMYMAPNTAPGPNGASRDAYNISMGIAWYPGRNARTPTVGGGCWMPYLPLGNNSNFLVDTIHFD
jgi:hypothetical protein